MTQFTRKNAWNNGGTFDNPDLLWYARAVQIMQSRPISDPTSWWFYAAIHGEYLLNPIKSPKYQYLNWTNIKYISPAAKLDSVPNSGLTNTFWDQCQHGTWFFIPWHRGYLVALEHILRDIIVNTLQGPSDWALPYWNYLNQSSAYQENNIPPAFLQETLPDGSSNPLLVMERYGPTIDVGNSMDGSQANDECQWDKLYYSDSDPSTNPGTPPDQLGNNIYGEHYGGGETGFNHGNSGDASVTGDLEMNPHNFVHGMVGGQSSSGQIGLMGVPATAALDPVFYLHHGNIDRMWSAWNQTGHNSNPTDANWLAGPSAHGYSQFAMPIDQSGTPWYYTPKDVQDNNTLKYYDGMVYAYTYDDLSLTSFDTSPPSLLAGNLSERLNKLNINSTKQNIQMPKNVELLGASRSELTLTGSEAKSMVHFDKPTLNKVITSLDNASNTNHPDNIYLQLEGVKGGADANFLTLYINNKFVRSISLFGLLSASLNDGIHGGSGLSYKFNISHIVDDLFIENRINLDTLDVKIVPKYPVPDDSGITIGRISLYRIYQ